MSNITVSTLQQRKQQAQKVTCLTSYDAALARLVDAAGVDVILVGDSLGMVVQGQMSTVPVTLEQMVYHTQCVARGVKHAFIVADLPFASYQTTAQAMQSAAALMQAGAHMVKLEGNFSATISALVGQGIPVCGHVGLLPQSVHRLGGYRVQGKGDAAQQIIEDALSIEHAGAQLIVFECIPVGLARDLTARLNVPTIGIGAGVDCDGQVLVIHDMLGITPAPRARFVKDFLQGADSISQAIEHFVEQVKQQQFPDDSHGYE